MSDFLKHECGIAMIRLLKPLAYYQEKYGTPLYGFNQLFLLMEKQHNRGQDGAGIGCVKLNVDPGQPYMARDRSIKTNPLSRIFQGQLKDYQKKIDSGVIHPEFPDTVKKHFGYGGEVLMGHLRYGTSGVYSSNNCHPFVRQSNWPTKNLMLAGNFTITNEKDINNDLINRGQHPIFGTDTQAVLEEVGFHLDEAHDAIYHQMRDQNVEGIRIPKIISQDLDPIRILKKAAANWDGGYTIAGLIGNGDSFVMRDPQGIRPCFYFQNDEVVAYASERVALMTIFNQPIENVCELEPGTAMVIKADGKIYSDRFTPECPVTPCSFERIYFSRGNDEDIYQERKALGGALLEQVVKCIGNDFANSVFSFVPNTAETAYYGLLDALRLHRRTEVKEALLDANANGTLNEELIDKLIMGNWPRGEKIAHKDIKLRTFISQEKGRAKLVSHVYDITYGIVKPKDSLVCIDDSIVRGTTLKESILKILSRTNPRKIVVASTAPQIRYPDCYGIDMSELGKFIAFKATVALIKEEGQSDLLKDVYRDCLEQVDRPAAEQVNHVRRLYDRYTDEQISKKIGELVYPKDIPWKGDLDIVFLPVEKMRAALPNNNGDWYFTGNYPTPGGYAALNKAYINFFEDKDGRAY
ncbi:MULTISPECIES: amidophosphoribosyltransferase [unclassified Lentimonas]|uniref:amidophosphoribosyltransferase n=1 Tax=unclassified Lentimonas TaxID=2630993 RepID=UPI001325ED30|nr:MULTISPECIES: amidophosphoribosyltransferase [unclassified Lentimonas]CAA6695039.1 Amidophosphoribosyltransferase (EC [Lentimonas sp. CC19]CAA6697165.1 Amidophosphoribosyltransferase (EC [Lentimonas sp. CC10]CAA7069828.1 Amidophosphoribosyltransferase (EC [Lentimonas sp. CC11]